MNLKEIKKFDNSWWLDYLEAKTVFDSNSIKDMIDSLIKLATKTEELEEKAKNHIIKIFPFNIKNIDEYMKDDICATYTAYSVIGLLPRLAKENEMIQQDDFFKRIVEWHKIEWYRNETRT